MPSAQVAVAVWQVLTGADYYIHSNTYIHTYLYNSTYVYVIIIIYIRIYCISLRPAPAVVLAHHTANCGYQVTVATAVVVGNTNSKATMP